MKSIALLLMFLPTVTLASPKAITIRCQSEMSQIKGDKKVPVIGDSNQRFEMTLKETAHGYSGEAQVRYWNDQSQDHSNSLHGAKLYIDYSNGNGIFARLGILKFANQKDDSAFEVTQALMTSSDYKRSLEEQVDGIMLGFLHPKLIGAQPNLPELIKSGELKDYDLISLTVSGCRLK